MSSEGGSSQSVDVAIAVVLHNGCVLIGQRGPEGPLAGLWEFPGGKVKAGEPPASAAERECLEETELPIRVEELLEVVEHSYAHARVRLHFFAASPLDPAVRPSGSFRWVSLRSLDAYAFPEANATVLRRLALRKGSSDQVV